MMSIGNTKFERHQSMNRLAREAAIELGLHSQGSELARRMLVGLRRRLPRDSSLRSMAKTLSGQLSSSRSAEAIQRRGQAAAPQMPADVVLADIVNRPPRQHPTDNAPAATNPDLSASDRQLLGMRSVDVIGDPDRFRRFTELQRHQRHPDTGKPVDVGQQWKRVSADRMKSDAKVIQQSSDQPDESGPTPSRQSTAVDILQLGLDAVGVVEPTPFADGANAAVSLFRGFVTDPSRRNEHLQNAGISVASMIPFVGDLAKLTKGRRAAKTVERAASYHKAGQRVAKTVHPWQRRSVSDFISDAKSGKVVEVGKGKLSLARLLGDGVNPRDAARTFLESHGGIDSQTGKVDLHRAAEAMQSMRQQAAGFRASPGKGGGGLPPVGPPPIQGGDPERDPREIERRIDGQRKLQELNTEFATKLTDTVLALGGFGTALVAGIAGIRRVIGINQGYVDANRYLEDFDAGVAGAYVRHDIQEMKRNIRKGKSLRDAIKESTEANSQLADVREQLTTPLQSIGMDTSATVTKVTADLLKVSDNLSGFSTGLERASVVVDLFTDAVTFTTDAVAKASELLSPRRLGERLGRWMTGRDEDDGKLNPDAAPWSQFLDDVRDGKFDGKGNAGEFFTKDF